MKFVCIDLHKKTISLCVMGQDRQVLERRRLGCQETGEMVEFFKGLGPFQAVVEATAGYEWMVQMIAPPAEPVHRLTNQVLLAHPKKLRVIAESTRKSDRLDAEILAEFLALDMIPEAYRRTLRERQRRRRRDPLERPTPYRGVERSTDDAAC